MSSFGVVYDPEKKTFDWGQFRALARLERKTDESLERYFHSFVSMCRTACRLPPRKDEGKMDIRVDSSMRILITAQSVIMYTQILVLCRYR